MRPVLRPGTHVLRRAGGRLQLGLDPGTALVLPDTSAVRDGLRGLTGPASGPGAAGAAGAAASQDRHDLLRTLEEHDSLLDADDLAALLGDGRDPDPAVVAALARDTGARLAPAARARRRWRTRTTTFGHPSGSGLAATAVTLARAAGLREATPRQRAAPDAELLLGVGEPDRELVDPWTRVGRPHLLVRLTEGRAVVGPFVVPGATACLRCLDAHQTDVDPAWPLLVRQYASASSRDRADGSPEPVDPALAALAVAWAVRDLATYVDGGRPSTWSATVTLHARLHRLESRPWLRHPACGCSWT